jgi:glycosyltransferase involved in cell wall biosynthesis
MREVMKLKVAIIGTRGYPSYYGGFETAVRHLAGYLSGLDLEVTVYSRKGHTHEEDPQRNLSVQVKYVPFVDSSKLSTLSHSLMSTLHLILKRPDAVIAMNVATGYWIPLCRMFRIPVILNVDGMEWERGKWSGFARAIFRGGALLSSKFSNVLVCDSVEIQKKWRELFGVQSVFIPYGSVEVDNTIPAPSLVDGKTVLWVARLVPENSINEFLTAAWLLPPEIKVVIVGQNTFDSETESKVLKLTELRRNSVWIKQISDDQLLHQLWKYAGVYFHGHSVGGTNPALVQAMRCGANILARDTIFNREVCADTVNYFELKPELIVNKIVKMLAEKSQENPRTQRARVRAESEYSWEEICASYYRLIISVVK